MITLVLQSIYGALSQILCHLAEAAFAQIAKDITTQA